MLFKILKLCMDRKNIQCKIPRPSVHEWTRTSPLKLITLRNKTIKGIFMLDRCFFPTPCCVRNMHSDISLNLLALFMLDRAANEFHILGLIGQHTSSFVSLQKEMWLLMWAEIAYFLIKFKVSWTMSEFSWNIVNIEY